ncbi:MAG TPA: imelysin family protein [Steroidobacteraceae bacterium]|nr:imelysin family protein [Steroidobacteraceae bacterium]
MRPFIRLTGVTVVAAVCVLSACSRQPSDDPRRPVVETYANLVAATYDDSLVTLRALDTAVDALLAAPSDQTLATARDRWREARVPYSRSEAFRFYAGPIDREGGPEGQINGWPLDENHIDAVAIDKYGAAPGLNIIGDPQSFPTITPELIAEQNEAGGEKNIASGYHAIEFLLWGQDLNDSPESAGQRTFADFVSGGDANSVNARRGAYLKAATTLLIRDVESVAAEWRAPAQGAQNYASSLVSGDVYTGLKRMLTGIITLAEVEMAGERMNVPLLSGDQEEEQSCFSDTTGEDLRANAAGIESVYFGRYESPTGKKISGPSLAEIVRKADPRVADEVEARLARTREALDAVRSPFDREIQPDNKEGQARVQAAIDSLHAQTQSFMRVAKALEIFLSPIQTDGD